MVPVASKFAKLGTAFDAFFMIYMPTALVAWTLQGMTAYRAVLAVIGAWLWWLSMSPRSKTRREIAAGDPKPWQFLRWMDISGPSQTSLDPATMAHTELYLRRLYVLRTPWFGIMLHWIKREDWDRDALHDHPWEFWRFIVKGGYTEELAFPAVGWKAFEIPLVELNPTTLYNHQHRTHRWLSFSKFPTGAFHRITSVKRGTVSLVINGPKSNSWGFFVPGTGKVPWRDYVNGAR